MILDTDRAVLQFSGGKDSLACLYLLEEHWSKIDVVWVNAGAHLPETLEVIESVRKLVPRFIEVKSNQPAYIEQNGYPVDVLPIFNIATVAALTSQNRPKLNGVMACCFSNVMRPMLEKCIDLNASLIIRGQKKTDPAHAPVADGDIIDGVRYWFPVYNWTDEQVIDYLGDRLPKHYKHVKKSLECWSCTAHLKESVDRFSYMKANHPEKHRELMRRVRIIKNEIQRDIAPLLEICDE